MDLYNYMTIENPCDMIPNIYRCFILRFMYNSGLWLTNSTAISLILERWLATIRSMTYEEDSILIGFFVAVVQVCDVVNKYDFPKTRHLMLLVAALPLCFLYSQTRFDLTMYYCTTSVISAPYFPQVGAGISSFFQIAGFLSFRYLLHVNKVRVDVAYEKHQIPLQKLREMDAHSSLSNRFQLEQNISSIICLKTFAKMSVFYIVFQNSCFMILMYFAADLKRYQFYAILELNGSWPAYGLVSVLVLANTIKKLRRRIDEELKGQIKLPNQTYIERFKKQIS
uniref:Solute carrier family 40 protein n=1 Tax=Caenorhabditis tropicalis TaxID=1561998 RepID=A0A1I7U9E4_9PELO